MRAVGKIDVGFEPAALSFEVVRLEGGKAPQEAVHGELALQGIKDPFRTLQVSLYLVTVVGCRLMCTPQRGFDLAFYPVDNILPARTAVHQ